MGVEAYIRVGRITGLKERFKTSYIAGLIKILFEFNSFFKLQNVLKIEFISQQAREGLISGCIFFCFVYR